MIHWDSPHPPPFFPLKTAMAEQNLQSCPLDVSPPSPQIAILSDLSTFPFYWHLPLELLALEQRAAKPELSSTAMVTCPTHPNPDCELHCGGLCLVGPPAQSCLQWTCKECIHAHHGPAWACLPVSCHRWVSPRTVPVAIRCLSHFLFWPQTWDHSRASLMFNC